MYGIRRRVNNLTASYLRGGIKCAEVSNANKYIEYVTNGPNFKVNSVGVLQRSVLDLLMTAYGHIISTYHICGGHNHCSLQNAES